MGLFGGTRSGGSKRTGRATDRRAGKVPHVGKQPRARNLSGQWRKKRSDAGKARGPRKKRVFGLF